MGLQAVIWGTRVSVEEAQRSFREYVAPPLALRCWRLVICATSYPNLARLQADVATHIRRFLTRFVDPNFGEEPHYMQLLKEIHKTEVYNLNIDCAHLNQYRPNL